MNRTLRAFYAFDGISLVKFIGRVFFLVPVLVIALFLLINLFLHDPGSLFYGAMTASAITPFLMLCNVRQCIAGETLTGGKYFRSMVHARERFVHVFHFQWLLGWMNIVWCIALYYLASLYLFRAEHAVTFDRMIFTAAQMTVVTACIPFSLIAASVYAELAVYTGVFTLAIMLFAISVRTEAVRTAMLFIAAAVLAFVSDRVLMHILSHELSSGRNEKCGTTGAENDYA
jgi:hypothetical protein